jgi:fluoroacetyl-CoA thioesterase
MHAIPGATALITLVVAELDTALGIGSGDVPVLGTPRLVALCEETSVAAVAPALDPGETTVGTRVAIDHLAATPIGAVVIARAVLESVEGRSLVFSSTVHQGERLVARAVIHRMLVDKRRFLELAGA